MPYAYLDTSVWIARAEGIPDYRDRTRHELRLLKENGWQFCYSDLVALETLIKPKRENRFDLMNGYEKVFSRAICLATFNSVFQDALSIAQQNGLRSLDAVHVAFAVKYGCDLFVTTDSDFRNLQSLPLHWIDLSHIS